MNAVEYFVNFYNELSGPGLLLFWSIITLFLFLIFSVIALLVKNNQLIKYINNMNVDESEKVNPTLGTTILNNSSLESNDEVFNLNTNPNINNNINTDGNEYKTINDALRETRNNLSDTGLYQRNILHEVGTKNQTSPINIGNTPDISYLGNTQKISPISIVRSDMDDSLVKEEDNDLVVSSLKQDDVNFNEKAEDEKLVLDNKMDINEDVVIPNVNYELEEQKEDSNLVLEEEKTSNEDSPMVMDDPVLDNRDEKISIDNALEVNEKQIKEEVISDVEENNNLDFVDEIEKEVASEVDEKPIELSEYETKQEEEAIISYEELKKNALLAKTREERFNVDVTDDDEFLNQLRNFKNNLE